MTTPTEVDLEIYQGSPLAQSITVADDPQGKTLSGEICDRWMAKVCDLDATAVDATHLTADLTAATTADLYGYAPHRRASERRVWIGHYTIRDAAGNWYAYGQVHLIVRYPDGT